MKDIYVMPMSRSRHSCLLCSRERVTEGRLHSSGTVRSYTGRITPFSLRLLFPVLGLSLSQLPSLFLSRSFSFSNDVASLYGPTAVAAFLHALCSVVRISNYVYGGCDSFDWSWTNGTLDTSPIRLCFRLYHCYLRVSYRFSHVCTERYSFIALIDTRFEFIDIKALAGWLSTNTWIIVGYCALMRNPQMRLAIKYWVTTMLR